MLCPKCGAYSPYNTAVCNRCGTKLLGEKAGTSPRRSRSERYYRRVRKSDWEQQRDAFLSRANDTLDGIMADESKRRLLVAAVIAAAVLIIASAVGCVSCACGGCTGCSDARPAVSAGDTQDSGADGSALLHSLLGDRDAPSQSDAPAPLSGSDAGRVSGTDGRPELPAVEPEDEDLVSITDYITDAHIDLKYSTADNFTGQVIYDFDRPLLRYGTVKKLMAVQDELRAMGLSLKIWDGFRPTQAQFRLWELYPDPQYVSDPNKGFSGHSRGNTVDLTVVEADGGEIPMPTGYDDFTALADRDYSDVPEQAAENAAMLEELMTRYGFRGYEKEWWHYTDTTEYPVIED